MSGWVTEIIKSTGYAGIVLLMFVENIFPPIPSEIVVPLSGFLVAKDQFTMAGVVIASTLGSMLGALAFYYAGYRLGVERLKQWCENYGHWVAITPKDINKAQQWLQRYGVWAVLLLRLVPGLRSLISLPAGIVKMPLGVFLLASTIGTAAWNVLLATIGYQLGSRFKIVEQWLGPVSTGVIILLLSWYIWRLINFYIRRKGVADKAT